MRIDFAPLEGITDVIYRRVHHAHFDGVNRYFIPFVSPTQHLSFTSREQRALSPEENAGVPVVPQILTKFPEPFLWMARSLADAGYEEINLNLGCPSGTVTAKGKGSGMLRDLDGLRAFLDAVCAQSPIPVSVKTRIGWESPEEWPRIQAILLSYPLKELILHPRTRREFYSGTPHREICADVLGDLPLVYNGDLRTAQDCQDLVSAYPRVSGLMIGRGLVANPALARTANGGAKITLEELRAFHDALLRAYLDCWPKNAVVGHMHEIMKHMLCCFEAPNKPGKAIRKSSTVEAYRDAVNRLFDEFPLRENPGYLEESHEFTRFPSEKL